PPVTWPFATVIPERRTATPVLTTNTREPLLPLTVKWLAPGPVNVVSTAKAGKALVRLTVPVTPFLNPIVPATPPVFARLIAARNEQSVSMQNVEPGSLVFVTM